MLRLRVPTRLAATALITAYIALAQPAAASEYSDALQCTELANLTTENWPADHPSTLAVNAIADQWKDYAAALGFPDDGQVDADLALQKSSLGTKMKELSGDPAAKQTYFAAINTRCSTPPAAPISPALCRAMADAQIKGSEMYISLSEFSLWSQSKDEAVQTRREIADARDTLTAAESASAHYASAGAMSRDDALAAISLSEPERQAKLDACIAQMG